MASLIADYLNDIKPSKLEKFFDSALKTPGVVSLGVGEPDFDTPWHISDEGIASIEEGKTFYTTTAGLPALREAVCAFLKRKYALSYTPDETLITVGASEAIDLACRALLNPGDQAILCEPAYVSYLPCIQLAHAKASTLVLKAKNRFQLTREDLEEVYTPDCKVLIINFPNNPTGSEMSQANLQGVAQFCLEHHLFVISDEIYSELTYGVKHHSLAEIPGMKDLTLVLNGFSKSYSMTGWRLGYACGPKEVIQAMIKIHQYTIMCPTAASQFAGIEALENGDKDIEKMREEFAKRRLYVLSRLSGMGLECFPPEGAFYVFPSIQRYGLSSEEFCLALLKEAKVVLIPGSAFGDTGEGFVRISYAYSLADLRLALDRLEAYLKKRN